MFAKPLEQIKFAEIVEFLKTGVREGGALEFKRDFPKDLEKTLAALANTYGGIILIGVEETESGAAILPIAGVELKPGLRERVLQKALEAIYPPILPDVRVVEFGSDASLASPDRALVAVSVAESADAPHAVDQRTTVYLRAGNVSTWIDRKANIGEIEWLLNKRQKSQELKKRLIAQANERAIRMRHLRRGRKPQKLYWKDGEMTVTVTPTFPRLSLMGLREWLAAVQQSTVEFDSAPRLLPLGRFQKIAGGASCDGEYGYSEYQQQGLILHEFDYWWDYIGPNDSRQVRQLYPHATAALIMSALLNASKLYKDTSYSGTVEVTFHATGLARAFFNDGMRIILDTPQLIESSVEIYRTITTSQLHDELGVVTADIQRELYWAFGFDAPDAWLIEDFKA